MSPLLQQTSLLTVNNLLGILWASCLSALALCCSNSFPLAISTPQTTPPSETHTTVLGILSALTSFMRGSVPSSQLCTWLSQSVGILLKFNMQN